MDIKNKTQLIEKLNNLIVTAKDGQEGFKRAAELLDDPLRKREFEALSFQRARFADQLKRQVVAVGGDPEDSGSFSGTLHRGWMGLKGSLIVNEEKTILEECERGESTAVSVYKETLMHDLPTNIEHLVKEQYDLVKASWVMISRETEEAAKAVGA